MVTRPKTRPEDDEPLDEIDELDFDDDRREVDQVETPDDDEPAYYEEQPLIDPDEAGR